MVGKRHLACKALKIELALRRLRDEPHHPLPKRELLNAGIRISYRGEVGEEGTECGRCLLSWPVAADSRAAILVAWGSGTWFTDAVPHADDTVSECRRVGLE